MVASANPHDALPRERAFIAADVGGTHVRIGLVRAGNDGRRPVAVLEYRKYVCADYAGLADVFLDFVAGLGGVRVAEAVVASAGFPLDDGTVISVNLPWPLSLQEIRERLDLADCRFVNDYEAVAHATARIDASEVLHLSGPETAPSPGPLLVLGPGTGLGAALRIPAQGRAIVLRTEAGQAALTVSNALEMALLDVLLKGRGHVSVEHVLSGPGLLHLHAALCAVRGKTAAYATPDAITAAAIAGDDALAVETLSVFCGLLGSTVGDMALLYGAQGGIYLAGGILPQIRDFLLRSAFVERFLNKGPMREALLRIPVKLVEHGQLGVIGAATWYLDERGAQTAATRNQGLGRVASTGDAIRHERT